MNKIIDLELQEWSDFTNLYLRRSQLRRTGQNFTVGSSGSGYDPKQRVAVLKPRGTGPMTDDHNLQANYTLGRHRPAFDSGGVACAESKSSSTRRIGDIAIEHGVAACAKSPE